jgi:cytochrome P450
MNIKKLDISSKQFSQNPYGTYAELRESGTVHYLSENSTWLIIGFNEIVEILNNTEVFSSAGENSFDPILLNCDPPKHTIHRRVLSVDHALFSSSRVSKIEAQNRQIANNLISGLLDKKSFDLLKDFALPFSSLVILNLLGLSSENNEELKEWSKSAVSAESIFNTEYALEKWEELKPIVRTWIEQAKQNPDKKGLSEIIFHPYSVESFSEEDILNLTKVLLLGGNETTPNLVSSALLILLNNNNLLYKVKSDYSLIDAVINETLRLEAPTQIIQRTNTKEVEIGGKLIPKGSLISLAIGAGNRDPSTFKNADEFDIDRSRTKILSFGFGPHYCIGAHLAKQEARIALGLLLETFPYVRLRKGADRNYRHSSHIRGLEKLELRVDEPGIKNLSEVKQEAIELLKASQLYSGEFPTYEYYPKTEELEEKGWHITAPSPFVHANVIFSLMNLKHGGLESVIEKGIEFIQSEKEYGNVWRFWKLGTANNNVPPDIDDTAICSVVLERLGIHLDNKKLLEGNIEANGVLKTWIYPKLSDFFKRPRLSYKWWREKQYYQPTVDANLLNLNDFELGVMANTLLCLGENSITKPSVGFCIDLWKDNKDTNHFYNNDLVISFHIARAYKGGIDSFKKLSTDILERIEIRFNTLSFPELLLAGLCIKYFKLTTNMESRIADRVKSRVIEEDFVFPHFEYFTSKDRNYVAGSPILVCCWFLELAEEWDL